MVLYPCNGPGTKPLLAWVSDRGGKAIWTGIGMSLPEGGLRLVICWFTKLGVAAAFKTATAFNTATA